MKGLISKGLAAVAGVMAAAMPAAAHHSYAIFDASIQYLMEATVVAVRFVSPHAELVLAIPGEGGWATWVIEGAAPVVLVGRGLTGTTLQPGDQVQLTYCARRDGTQAGHGGWLRHLATVDSRPFDPQMVYVLTTGPCQGNNFAAWQEWMALGATTNVEGNALQAAASQATESP